MIIITTNKDVERRILWIRWWFLNKKGFFANYELLGSTDSVIFIQREFVLPADMQSYIEENACSLFVISPHNSLFFDVL